MDGDAFTGMCSIMEELALRGQYEESLMLRVAVAGSIESVEKTIKSRRIMRKKFNDSPAKRDVGPESTGVKRAAKKKGGRRKGAQSVGVDESPRPDPGLTQHAVEQEIHDARG